MTTRTTLKVLADGDVVPFVAGTSQYGRAEFRFCTQWEEVDETGDDGKPTGGKRSVVKSLFIYPMQQPDTAEHYYQVDSGYSDMVTVGSWTHKGMENPWIWRHGWCQEHNCQFFDAYVPPDAINFQVRLGSSLGIDFDNGRPS